MRTKPVSAPSLTRLHSNSLDLSLQQLNNTPVHFNNCVNPTHKGPKDMTLFQDVNLHRPKNQLRKVRKLKIILLICLILRKIWKRNNTRAFNHTKVCYYLSLRRIQGRGPGGPPLSPLFLDQTEAEKSFFWDWAFWHDNAVCRCVIAYLLWFNFILNSNFIFITDSHSLSYIIIPPKKQQRTIWLEPRFK